MNQHMAFISPTPCLAGSVSHHSPLSLRSSTFSRPLALRVFPVRRSTIYPPHIFAQETQPQSESEAPEEPAPVEQAPEAGEPAVSDTVAEQAEAETPVAEEAAPVVAENDAESKEAEGEAEGEAGGDRRRKRRRGPKREVTLPLEQLTIGMELEGSVRGVTDYGAFIGGLGTPTDGLLHVSQLAAGYIEKVSDVCKIGDTVKVRVMAVDLEKKTFSLTMKTEEEMNASQRPSQSDRRSGASRREEQKKKWETFTFDPEVFIDAKVLSITDFGAFCQLLNEDGTNSQTAPTDGLAHISALSTSRVEKVSDVLKVGQVIKVRVVSADPERNRISLTLKPVSGPSDERQSKSNNSASDSGMGESSNVAEDIAAAEASQPVFKTAFQLAFERANYQASNK